MTAEEYLSLSSTYPPRKDRTDEQEKAITSLYYGLSPGERRRVGRIQVEAYFVEGNRAPNPQESHSPSGHYKLTITSYGTQPGAWNYTRGIVTRVSDGTVVADVKRNYSSFPHLWIEDHPSGTDLFVCGEDYQGQTVIDLQSGQRKDHLPESAEKGAGFCWSSYRTSEDKTVLVVSGCFWACPYEYRIYDFSAPMSEKGWPELQVDADLYSDDNTTCEIVGDVLTWSSGERVFKATGERSSVVERKSFDSYRELSKAQKSGAPEEEVARLKALHDQVDRDYPDEDGDEDKWEKVVDHRASFKLAEGRLIVIEEWKSEHKLESERASARYREEQQARMHKWMAEDPLHQVLPTDRGKTTFWYPSMDARDRGEKNPAFFSVPVSPYKEGRRRTGAVEWGVSEGDVRAVLCTYGIGEKKSDAFPRTVEGLRSAWAVAVAHEGGAS